MNANIRTEYRLRIGMYTLVLAIVCAVAALSIAQPKAVSAPQRPLGYIGDSSVGTQPEFEGFLLRSEGGCIAIYSSESLPAPFILTDIEVATLRELDRDLLEQGILTSTREEMLSLLEDFGS